MNDALKAVIDLSGKLAAGLETKQELTADDHSRIEELQAAVRGDVRGGEFLRDRRQHLIEAAQEFVALLSATVVQSVDVAFGTGTESTGTRKLEVTARAFTTAPGRAAIYAARDHLVEEAKAFDEAANQMARLRVEKLIADDKNITIAIEADNILRLLLATALSIRLEKSNGAVIKGKPGSEKRGYGVDLEHAIRSRLNYFHPTVRVAASEAVEAFARISGLTVEVKGEEYDRRIATITGTFNPTFSSAPQRETKRSLWS